MANNTSCIYTTQKRLMVFAGRSNPAFGLRIAEKLGIDLGGVLLKSFANGESYARFDESIRGADVFIVQSPSGIGRLNDEVIELLIMIQAAKLASARRVTAVVPYYPYARQDKKSAAREPITARLMATLLEAAGADRVLSMDLHQGQIQGFFQIPVDHMTAVPMLADYFKYKDFGGRQLVGVSADAGGVKLVKRFNNHLPETGLAVLTKARPEHNQAETLHFIGDVTDKIAVVVDDMIDTAGSIMSAVDTLYTQGGARGLRDRDPRHLQRARARAHPRVAGQGGRGDRHARDPARAGGHQDHRAQRGRHPGQYDQERLRGRVGERPVRRREPALLAGDPMDNVRLPTHPRHETGTRAANRLRKQGLIPGVLYGHGKAAVMFAVEPAHLREAMSTEAGRNAVLEWPSRARRARTTPSSRS